MSNHTNNWAVLYVTTTPNGTNLPGVVFGRTRAEARKEVVRLHTNAPHGFRVRHAAPRKVPTV